VWKLDRLSRSLKDVLHIMERIADAGAGFRSITENIDTTTPAGRMMMQMVGAFAEFERAMIRERTSAGLAAARAEGRIGGRRKKLDAARRREIAESVVSGRKSGADMARLYGASQPTRVADRGAPYCCQWGLTRCPEQMVWRPRNGLGSVRI
jgi:DNA invertase Pin-like site-specific DNA recombinase